MKLMIITPYFPPSIGGMEKHIYTIAKGINQKYNWKIVVVTSNHKGKTYKEETLEGIKIYRLPRQFKISNTPISFKWKKQIKEIIEKEKPDVINGRGPVPFISDVASKIAYESNIPFVLGWHFPTMKKGIFYLDWIISIYENVFLKKMAKRARAIICSSDYVKKTLFKNFSEKTITITQGLNKEIFTPKKIFYKNNVLFVGNFTTEIKGLTYLLEAIKLVKPKIPNTKLNVVGVGNINKYRRICKKLNITKNVEFLKELNGQKLVWEYQKNTVFVLPSINDNLPSVLLEAMACKKPVIGSNIGGIPYVIDHNKNGLLVPPKDPKALAEAIIKILKNPKLAKQMGEAGYKKVKKNFTWDNSIEKTKKAIIGVIQR